VKARRVIAGLFALPVVAVAAVATYTGIRAAGYEKYWRDRAAEPRPADALTLVAFGDSATVGVGALNPSNGFVSRAAKLVTEHTGRPVHIVNLASGGATVNDVLQKQLPRIDAHSADLVLLCTSNDLEQRVPLPRYREDLELVLAALPAERTVVSDLPLMPGRGAYQEVLEQVADTSGVRRADFASVFTGDGHRLDIFSLLPPHLNDRGYGYWFDAFRPKLLGIIDASAKSTPGQNRERSASIQASA
jgi:lysophospholipase L1-like esterase